MAAKEFAWSYSKFKNFDTCAKRHYEVDIAKHFVDTSDQLTWGNEVHDTLAKAVTTGDKLPDSMETYQKWVDEMRTGEFFGDSQPPWMRHLKAPGSVVEVEKKYAITRQFAPTAWFANNVWFRGVCDVVRFDPTKTVALARDYKTGKVVHDSRQLMLMAQCLFSHTPSLTRLRTEFVWLKDDCTTVETFDRSMIHREWVPILPLVKVMEDAARTMNYPPKPGKLCRSYCPVVSCPFHGKSHR